MGHRMLHFEPPWMDRKRYENASNIWYPCVFTSANLLGRAQNLLFDFWNWGVRSIWHGRPTQKVFALGVTCIIWFPIMVQCHATVLCFRMTSLPRFIKQAYLRLLPENVLIMEQLMVAHEIYG